MSKSRLLRHLRRQDYYRPMLRALAEFGVQDFEILPPTGLGHPILAFHNGVHDVRIPLPGTPSGGASIYVPRQIRRSCRRARRVLAERSEA